MKLTKRQLEMLKVHAGLIKESPQSYYYGHTAVVNRALKEKGLIENPRYQGWKVTPAGWAELQKRYRNFPAQEAWKLATKTSISQWQP